MEYKCIRCGNLLDIKDEDGRPDMTCPACADVMLRTPYDRREALIRLIADSVRAHTQAEVTPKQLRFTRREQGKGGAVDLDSDLHRFPSWKQIDEYLRKAKKTEDFFARLEETLSEIMRYQSTDFSRRYRAEYGRLLEAVSRDNNEIGKIKSILGTPFSETELSQPALPEVTLYHTETPDDTLAGPAEELATAIKELAGKAKVFIRQYNIYSLEGCLGAEKDDTEKKTAAIKGRAQALKALEAQTAVVRREIMRVRTPDVLSDGTEDAHEMLIPIWNALSVLRRSSVLRHDDALVFPDGARLTFGDGCARLSEALNARFGMLQTLLENAAGWESYDEKSIFDKYSALREIINPDRVPAGSGRGERMLDELVGLKSVRDSILKIKAYALANRDDKSINLHMCFYGNPGTGKTEVARIIGQILHDSGILKTGQLVEADRSALVGEYVGETPIKTMAKINEAMGGVLFIDEAYALIPADGGFDYGHEAVATLIKAMEDKRGQFCVILAGYRNQMENMIASNPGFKSRIQFELDFPDYSRGELGQIADRMLAKRGYTAAPDATEKMLDITDVKRREPNFANAREVRNILDQVIMCQNVRIMSDTAVSRSPSPGEAAEKRPEEAAPNRAAAGGKSQPGGTPGQAISPSKKQIILADVNRYIRDAKINLPTAAGDAGAYVKKIMTADEELEQLIGLAAIKQTVRKIRAYAKRNRDDPDFSLHMCFTGNPGTGKTEVARILSRILYKAGALPEAKTVETDAAGLIGKYVGETAPKTKDKVREAMGGVLFIDEAYGLIDNRGGAYGDEAVTALIKEMEDRRGRFCVILAGYREEMRELISSNPGLESRLQFTLDFPDYTREEMAQIARLFFQKKQYTVTDAALEKLLDAVDAKRDQPDFANARTLRNMVNNAIMNQNLRTEDMDEPGNEIVAEDIDEPEISRKKPNRIGF